MQTMLLFDLDDTLINTHLRHYKVVSDFFVLHNKSFIGFDEYVKLRRDRSLSNTKLINEMEPGLSETFKEHWCNCIESQNYLKSDTPIVSTVLLEKLKNEGYIIGIVSLRSNSKTAAQQLNTFDWFAYFERTYFLSHSVETNPKIDILKTLATQYILAGLVGDAETDRQAAEQSGIFFYGVKTGLYNSDTAYKYSDVNAVIDDILKNRITQK